MKLFALPALLAFSALSLPAEDEANQAVLKLNDPIAELNDKQWDGHPAVATGDFYSIVTFQDRFSKQIIDIAKRGFHKDGELPATLKTEFIGTFSGEARPAKFFTPLVMSEQESLKRLK